MAPPIRPQVGGSKVSTGSGSIHTATAVTIYVYEIPSLGRAVAPVFANL